MDTASQTLNEYQEAADFRVKLKLIQKERDNLTPVDILAILEDVPGWHNLSGEQEMGEAFALLLPLVNDLSELQTLLEKLESLYTYFPLDLIILSHFIPFLDLESRDQKIADFWQNLESNIGSNPYASFIPLSTLAHNFNTEECLRAQHILLQHQFDSHEWFEAITSLCSNKLLPLKAKNELLSTATKRLDTIEPIDYRSLCCSIFAPVLDNRVRAIVIEKLETELQNFKTDGIEKYEAYLSIYPFIDDTREIDKLLIEAVSHYPAGYDFLFYLEQLAQTLPATFEQQILVGVEKVEDPQIRIDAIHLLEQVYASAASSAPLQPNASAVPPKGTVQSTPQGPPLDKPDAPEKTEPKPEEKQKPEPKKFLRDNGTDITYSHLDNPALEDLLERKPFAKVIAETIRQVYIANQSSDYKSDDACLIHIHGPWGSGKTSVLNFLKEELTQKQQNNNEPWVVIEFNAWQYQHVGSPWWSLISSFYEQGKAAYRISSKLKLWLRHSLWQMKTRNVTALVTLGLAIWVLSMGFDVEGKTKYVIEVVAVFFALIAAVSGAARGILLGSSSAAEQVKKLSADPMQPLVTYFKGLVDDINQPVVVFIDDMDRCDNQYVVELLRGIQTLFRHAGITYVVTSDRVWLRNCYSLSYPGFTRAMSKPGRPLGSLFIEKIFQLSIGLPKLSPNTRNKYLAHLVTNTGDTSNSNEQDLAAKALEEELSNAIEHEVFLPKLKERIAQEKSNIQRERALRLVVAKKLMSKEVSQSTQEHILMPYAELFENNPRAMKRLVNTFSIHQAVALIMGLEIEQNAIVLWSLIELRWPLLADYLADHPYALNSGLVEGDNRERKEIQELLQSHPVQKVIHGKIPQFQGRLEVDDIILLTGAARE